jgi:FkbM family methyltransferase
MKILYGIPSNNIDVTSICLSKLKHNGFITIPAGDTNRAFHFTDPLFGIQKDVIIINNNKILIYNPSYTIKINLLNNTISAVTDKDIINKLTNIQSKLKIKYGSFNEELPEQKMVARYLNGHEKVLEIGGNIGRNTLIIASILERNNNNNFLTLESDVNIAKQLTENRDLNNFKFHIESSALSNRKLIQRGWDTIPSDTLQDGYTWVNTISLNELNTKYNIEFDTLILDCEGAFYYILMDMPEILNNINLIVMENDYYDISHKKYVDEILTENNFYVDYVEGGGWGPCSNNFFEVWKKIN